MIQLKRNSQAVKMPKSQVPKLRRSRVKAFNPTLSIIEEDVDRNPEVMRNAYRPYMIHKEREKVQQVYKRDLTFTIDMTQYSLIVTNIPYTCYGSDYKFINDFKSTQYVTFPDSLVCFAWSTINKAEKDRQAFCMDIPSFLHVFSMTSDLNLQMEGLAEELSRQWNTRNSLAKMKGSRLAEEAVIFLDFRQNSKASGVSELVLAGTTWDFTTKYQDENREIICEPEDIIFSLRYQLPKEQTSDGTAAPKKGQLRLTAKGWKRLFQEQEVVNTHNEVWNKWPLAQSYSERLQEYNILNSKDVPELEEKK